MTTGLHRHFLTQLVILPALSPSRWLTPLLLAAIALSISACSSIISSASNRLADNVTKGLLSQDDPSVNHS